MTIQDKAEQALNATTFLTQNKAEIARQLLVGHETFPFALRQMMRKYGDTVVTSIDICRTPLGWAMRKGLDLLSFGKMKQRMRKQGYDKLFHLKLIVNNRFTIEKHITCRVLLNANRPKGTDTETVTSIPQNTTLKSMMENTHKAMGQDMFNYDGVSNNCQHFVTSILKANGLWNNAYDVFINQDIEKLVEGYAVAHGIVNGLTTALNRGQFLTEGAGFHIKTTKYKLPKALTTTSESELIELCKRVSVPLVGVYMRDEMSQLKDGCYIMNLESMQEDGSHWTAFVKHRSNIYYSDSYGVTPPQNQIDLFKKESYKLFYNTQINQHITSRSCGYWCVLFLHHMTRNPKQKMVTKMTSFNKMFNAKNAIANEKLLKQKIIAIYK